MPHLPSSRHLGNKALVVVAAQLDGKGLGRIRLRRVADASSRSLHAFVQEAILPGPPPPSVAIAVTLTRTAGVVLSPEQITPLRLQAFLNRRFYPKPHE